MRRVYLDHNATTPVDPRVKAAMMAALDEFGNPSSLHVHGQRAAALLEQAREQVAALLNADPLEIYFTSGGTEANNLALRGAVRARAGRANKIVTSAIEHPSVLKVVEELGRSGFAPVIVPVGRDGRVEPAAMIERIDADVALVSLMAANNETGALQPVAEVGEACRERGVLFHVDAIQLAGKLPLDVKALGLDFVTLSGHKFHGPKGVGALYKREAVALEPLLRGGGQERGLRAGTENVPGAVGLGVACQTARLELADRTFKIAALRDRFERGVFARVPDVAQNGNPGRRLPNTTNLSFAGAEGEAILINLDLQGVEVSTGSACGAGAAHQSHVLTAMGLDPRTIGSSIRFSFGKDNNQEDVDSALEALVEAVARIRSIAG